MYTEAGHIYDAIYRHREYATQAEHLHALISERQPNARTLLDVACATGRHLEVLARYYEAQGLDINPTLLEIARKRCPTLTFHEASMLDFHLHHSFDVITCLFSSIAYVKSLDRLEQALERMSRHLTDGGLLIVEPWFTPQTYWTGTITANHVDEPDFKLTWMYTSEAEDGVSILDMHYLVGRPGSIERFHERHELGLFTNEQYETAFRRAGLEVSWDPTWITGRGLYVGVKAPPRAAATPATERDR